MTSDRTPRPLRLALGRLAAAALLLAALAGCAGATRPGGGGAAASVPPVPLDEGLLAAADKLFAGAADGGAARREIVIDPLIDGATGEQSAATLSMQSRIEGLVRERHAGRFEVLPFSSASLARSPLVLLGSLTGLSGGEPGAGPRAAYRVWLVLADLERGTIVARSVFRAAPEGVDPTPLRFFRDSPAWRLDPGTRAYLATCAGDVGDPVAPAYLEGLLTAALIADAVSAYDRGRYREALDLYQSASRTPAGADQLRVLNGLYLANWRLGRREQAEDAFGRIVDQGLAEGDIAVKFLFGKGSSVFLADPAVSGPYDLWLRQIATRTARRGTCLDIIGHTSPSGPATMNDRLSLLRAQHVEGRLEEEEPRLREGTSARGAGSRENIIGTGADDASDALDRRVTLDVVGC